jgi:uncharacterized membrane protein
MRRYMSSAAAGAMTGAVVVGIAVRNPWLGLLVGTTLAIVVSAAL